MLDAFMEAAGIFMEAVGIFMEAVGTLCVIWIVMFFIPWLFCRIEDFIRAKIIKKVRK